jgi:hypothetical protein
MEVCFHSFLILALTETIGFMSDHFTPTERAPIVHRVGGCVGPKASVNGLKNLLPVLGIVSQLFGHPAPSVLTLLTG